MGRCRAAGEQEWGGENQCAGEGDGRAYAEEAAEDAPERGQQCGRGLGRHRPGGEGAGGSVGWGVLEAVGGVDRVEDTAAEDEPELDGCHQQQPARACPQEGQADGPERAQGSGREQDLMLSVSGHERAGEA